MKSFDITMLAELQIKFSEPLLAKAYFIDGEWRETFWDIDNMHQLAKNIANAVQDYPAYYDKGYESFVKSPEGFGVYVRQTDGSYKATWKDFGDIIVTTVSELNAEESRESDA